MKCLLDRLDKWGLTDREDAEEALAIISGWIELYLEFGFEPYSLVYPIFHPLFLLCPRQLSIMFSKISQWGT